MINSRNNNKEKKGKKLRLETDTSSRDIYIYYNSYRIQNFNVRPDMIVVFLVTANHSQSFHETKWNETGARKEVKRVNVTKNAGHGEEES